MVNIRPADDPIQVDGIGSHLIIDEVGDLLDIGTVYLNPSAAANVVSHATLEDAGTNTYDQANSSFTARIQNTYVFHRVRSGKTHNLYACNLRPYSRGRFGTICVNTEEQNEALFTKRKVGDVRRARDLSRRMGYPSVQHLIQIMKWMENSPFIIHDVYRAAKIWGPEVAYIKGTNRNVTPHIPIEHIPLALGRALLTMHVDLMYAEKQAFLYSKTTPLGLRMVHHLGSGEGWRSAAVIAPKLALQLSEYKSAGFEIGTLLSDNKGGVAKCHTMLQDKGVTIIPSSAGKHVPEIENDRR